MQNKENDIWEDDPHKWLHRADRAMISAESLFATVYPRPLEIIGAICQLSAEESIKAIYLALPGYKYNYPRSHDIGFMLQQLKNYVEIKNSFLKYADLLTGFKTKMLYPSRIEPDESIIKKGIDITKEIHKWAEEIVIHKKHLINKNLSR